MNAVGVEVSDAELQVNSGLAPVNPEAHRAPLFDSFQGDAVRLPDSPGMAAVTSDIHFFVCACAFKKIDVSQIKVSSLSESHTNFVCRILDQEAPHVSETISSNGKLSKELLKRVDPNFH